MMPIFDLVLNHVAKDSPLVRGEFSHFTGQKIDTSKWFKNNQSHWDDIIPFDYEDAIIRKEIITYLWLPYIRKYISKFGFMGVRVDFATGISPEVQRELLPELNRLVKEEYGVDAIIFAECLPPRGLEQIAKNYRELYTHVTNNAVFTLEAAGHDMGLKMQLTHLNIDGSKKDHLGGGTIGFSSSHDDGPNARNALHHQAIKKIHHNDFKKYIFYESHEKKQRKEIERATTELIDDLNNHKDEYKLDTWMIEQRKRLAICALVSDGGTYLLGGDEFGDATPKSVFETINGDPIYNEADNFSQKKKNNIRDHSDFICNINRAISDMPQSIFPHWSKVIHLEGPYDNLVVVMNYNGSGFSDHQPELTIVNTTNDLVTITDPLIRMIAKKNSLLAPHDSRAAFDAVIHANKKILGNCHVTLSTQAKLYNHHSINTSYNNKFFSANKFSTLKEKSPEVKTNEDKDFKL